MASADEGSSRMCVSCGRSIAMDANVCQHCGHDFRAPAPAEKKKTLIPVVGGILILIAGIMGLIMGGVLLAIDLEDLDQWGVDVAGVTDVIEDVLTVCGAIIIILSIVTALGGVFGIMRKHWGIAVVGGVLGLFVIGPMALGTILALIGLILVAVSRKEFD
ncbi:MAG: zinc ribbon domain-containing protein [Methanobacteriota archaeon]|nr:MAG: zinc ribbon domain-containing protein [Euryarchaeota archaeon]